MIDRKDLLDRAKRAAEVHRATLRGESLLPPPKEAPRGSFLHGFFLPFSLIVATLRDPELGRPYLLLTGIRAAVVLAAAVILYANGEGPSVAKPKPKVAIVHTDPNAKPVKVDVPGVHVDLDEKAGKREVVVLGQPVPVAGGGGGGGGDRESARPTPTETPKPEPRVVAALRSGWKWLLAVVAFLSALEGVIVFFSRRYDDWISFHGSRLAEIEPEDDAPKEARLAIDLPWLYRKLKRRFRGYAVFAAGVPSLLPLRLAPVVGEWLFGLVLALWGWYWLGVFTAAKSAHAWADEATAPPPFVIRTLNERVVRAWWTAPIRAYGRAWAWITRGMNPAATTFERSPAPFLGLALARAVLALPGLYLLARPIVPIAAGRLCAEADPNDRFAAPRSPAAPR